MNDCIYSKLNDIFVGEYFQRRNIPLGFCLPDISSLHVVCVHVWLFGCWFLQALLSDHSGAEVVKSLGEVAKQEAVEIRQLTASLDPHVEAASLKCVLVWR